MHRIIYSMLSVFLFYGFLIGITSTPSNAKDITVKATPIEAFDLRNPEITQFGKLEFLGGVELASKNKNFGGISGLRFIESTRNLIAVTDNGRYLTATLVRNENKPHALENAMLFRLRGAKQKKLKGKKNADSEGIEIIGDQVLVSFERKHRIETYSLSENSKLKHRERLPVNFKPFDLPNNSGLEAIAVAPEASPLAGSIITFAEHFTREDDRLRGFLIKDDQLEEFLLDDIDGFSVTDAAFLPDGDLVILERRFSFFTGIALRMRRLKAQNIQSGDAGRGEILMEANGEYQIDNMEGLAITENDDGHIRFTLMSDDNFSDKQRTLLLEFGLVDK